MAKEMIQYFAVSMAQKEKPLAFFLKKEDAELFMKNKIDPVLFENVELELNVKDFVSR